MVAKRTFFASLFTLSFFIAKAEISKQPILSDTTIPKVFVLGQFDGKPFEKLKADYETNLVSVTNNDMETAYFCWMHMLKHMESHAGRNGFDLNGVKMWLYVFWNKDGGVDHISYYLKPNSKNVKQEEMVTFLNDFVKNYTFPVKFEKGFSNYSNAAFPVMIEKQVVNSKGNGGLGNKE